MKLVPTFQVFQADIDRLIAAGEQLKTPPKPILTEQDLSAFKEPIKAWVQTSADYLKNAFDPADREAAQEFRAGSNGFYIPGTKLSIPQLMNNEVTSLDSKIQYLRYFKKIIAISDKLLEPERVEKEQRHLWDTEQILELLLFKLHALYDELYHSFPCNDMETIPRWRICWKPPVTLTC
jgi:hypothetical protein